MTITPEQREERRKYLGASDVPVVLGLSDLATTTGDIYWSKLHGIEDKPKPHMELGNALEPVLVQLASVAAGREAHTGAPMRVHPGGILACNLDAHFGHDNRLTGGVGICTLEPIECKLRRDTPEWKSPKLPGPIWSRVPFHELLQTWAQMACWGAERGWISVLLYGRFGLTHRLYEVPYDAERIVRMVARCEEWWRRYVVAKVPPPQRVRREVVWNTERQPASVHIDPALVERYERCKVRRLRAQKAADAAVSDLLVAMGDSTAAIAGERRVFFNVSDAGRKSIKVEANE